MREFILDNGLTVQLIDKPGFKKQFAAVMVDFGGVDQQYQQGQQVQELPAGTAHFIEHQLFNKVSGDISQLFSQNGAETNAFTSPSKTAYFFSGTSHLMDNLNLLAQLVGEPYFQTESVARERQIIGQELSLYQDQPDFQLETGLMEQLYGPKHPMAVDIAGTPASLQQITPEVLYAAYQAYYRPKNMKLCVTADFSQLDIAGYFADVTNPWSQLATPADFAPAFTQAVPEPAASEVKQVPFPTLKNNKWSLGIIAPLSVSQAEQTLVQLDVDLILTTLFGETSSIFQSWRKQGLIDDSFQFQTTLERQYHHIIFTANTDQGAELSQQLLAVLRQLGVKQLTNFRAIQQQMIGTNLFAEDDLGGVCLENLELSYYNCDWPTFGQALRTRTLAQSLTNVQQLLKNSVVRSYSLLGGN